VRDVEYEVSGLIMRGRLAAPDGEGPFPAMLIAPEASGLDEFQASRADSFAKLGYVGFAFDYYGGGRVLSNPEAMMNELSALGSDPDEIRRRAQAALDVVVGEPLVDPSKVAAAGYCFGETVVMELGRTGADLKAIIGLHPGLNIFRPGESRNIRGKVLMCVGADDPIVPLAQRIAFEEEMRFADVDWQMIVYGGAQHSFTNPRATDAEGIMFDQLASDRSWQAMLALLAEIF
jgi:dienelactone hydrolase